MEQWQRLSEGPFFRSARLDCALSCTRGALLCRKEGEKLLAIPYAQDAPFPLAELFCLARIQKIDGKDYAVYRLDSKNSLIL